MSCETTTEPIRWKATAEQVRWAYEMPDGEALRVARYLARTHISGAAFYRNPNLISEMPDEDHVLNPEMVAARIGVEITVEADTDSKHEVGPCCIEASDGRLVARGVAVWFKRERGERLV